MTIDKNMAIAIAVGAAVFAVFSGSFVVYKNSKDKKAKAAAGSAAGSDEPKKE